MAAVIQGIASIRRRAKAAAATAAAAAGLVARRRNTAGLLILMFHKVNDRPDPLPLTVSPALFETIVAEVRHHHDVVAVEGVDGDVDDPRDSPGLKLAFTFDDGYRDTYENAYPILQRAGLPATVYLSTGHVDGRCRFWYEELIHALGNATVPRLDLGDLGLGAFGLGDTRERHAALLALNDALKAVDETRRTEIVRVLVERSGAAPGGTSRMMTWDMAREMAAAGIGFGSHTVTHPILSREAPERVRAELVDSRRRIEAELGREVRSFAYPNGTAADFNGSVVAQVREAGYRNACTTIEGINVAARDRFALLRVNVHPAMCTDGRGAFHPDLFWAKALGLLSRRAG